MKSAEETKIYMREAKRAERAKWRAMGWEYPQFRVHRLDLAAVRKFIDKLNRKRGKQ